MLKDKCSTIEAYISSFPLSVQHQLNEVYKTIKNVAPNASEAIKYGMPTFVLNGNLVHFAAYKNHIGFYPAPLAIVTFAEELSAYKTSKGAIQFPLKQDLPLALITKIVQFRIKQNLAKNKTS